MQVFGTQELVVAQFSFSFGSELSARVQLHAPVKAGDFLALKETGHFLITCIGIFRRGRGRGMLSIT